MTKDEKPIAQANELTPFMLNVLDEMAQTPEQRARLAEAFRMLSPLPQISIFDLAEPYRLLGPYPAQYVELRTRVMSRNNLGVDQDGSKP